MSALPPNDSPIARALMDGRAWHRSVHGRSPRRWRIPKQRQPDTISLAYFAELRHVTRAAKALVDLHIVPMLPALVAESGRRPDHMDGARNLKHAMEGVRATLNSRFRDADLERTAAKYADATSRHQKDQLARQLRAGLGIDVPIQDGRRVLAINEHFAVENEAFIKSIPRRYFEAVEAKVLAGVGAGRRWEDIATDLQDRYGVSEASAKLIARDQVGKLQGALNQVRQEDLGITSYLWRTSGDNRVREEHADRDGDSFDWDDAPEDGHPGQPISCRCWADPDLSAVLDSL